MKRSESFNDYLSRLYLRFDPTKDFRRNAARTVTFQVTEACNLKCSYCYQVSKSTKRMSLETGKKIVDLLLEGGDKIKNYLNSEEVVGVVLDFIGGEPFLEVELIDQIMDYFKERTIALCHPWATKYKISISTNGTLYFTEPVQRFVRKWRNHLSVGVSIDGNKKLHDACRVFPDGKGSYDLALAAALDLKKRFGYNGTKLTVAPGNVEFLHEAVSEMLRNGYREINLNCVFEEGWTPEHARVFYHQLKRLADTILEMDEDVYISAFEESAGKPIPESENRNWCGGTGMMLAFDTDGNAFPCVRYMGSSMPEGREPYTIGNLCDGVACTECDKHKTDILNAITRRSQSSDECWNCPIASGCAWCSGYNYQVFGTPNRRATFICIMHRARVLATCYYWNRKYRKDGSDKRFPLYVPDSWGREIAGDDFDMLLALSGGE